MDDARRDEVAALIQARCFELVDEQGRVRAVLGDVSGRGGYAPGLELRNAAGQARTWYALLAIGPSLNFEIGENDVLNLGVNEEGLVEDHPDYDPNAFISLSDRTGQQRWHVSVHHDGGVELRVDSETPAATGDDSTG